jgi:hypothetical protein
VRPVRERGAGERGLPWLGAALVSLGGGLGGFLASGDLRRSVGLGALIALSATVFLLLFPRHVDRSGSWRSWALLAACIALGQPGALALGVHPTPWLDLQESFPATSPAPAAARAGYELRLLQETSPLLVQPYEFKRAQAAFETQGVWLALSWPLGWIYDPLWVPLEALGECRPAPEGFGFTALRVRGAGLVIEVSDRDGEIAAWCRRSGLE